jgi:hypothetical protein
MPPSQEDREHCFCGWPLRGRRFGKYGHKKHKNTQRDEVPFLLFDTNGMTVNSFRATEAAELARMKAEGGKGENFEGISSFELTVAEGRRSIL